MMHYGGRFEAEDESKKLVSRSPQFCRKNYSLNEGGNLKIRSL